MTMDEYLLHEIKLCEMEFNSDHMPRIDQGAKSNGLARLSLRPKPKESSWYQTQPTHPTERGLSQMTWRR